MSTTVMAADSDFIIENGVLKQYTGSGGDVVIPSSVQKIDWDVFEECSGLTSVTIPDSVTNIGGYAFARCKGLTTVSICDRVFQNPTVYKIGGSNYFKLRDLGKALDFYVGYDSQTGMFIETDKPYAE